MSGCFTFELGLKFLFCEEDRNLHWKYSCKCSVISAPTFTISSQPVRALTDASEAALPHNSLGIRAHASRQRPLGPGI